MKLASYRLHSLKTAWSLRPRVFAASLAFHAGLLGFGLAYGLGDGGEPPPRVFSLAMDRPEERFEIADADPEPPTRAAEEAPPVEPEPVPEEEFEPFQEPEPEPRYPDLFAEPVEIKPRSWFDPLRVVAVREVPKTEEATPVPVAPPPAAEPTPVPGENPPPRYPRLAIRLRLEGTALVEVHVDAEGRVTRCMLAASSGHRILDEAACRSLARWNFRDGPGVTRIPVVYQLSTARVAGN